MSVNELPLLFKHPGPLEFIQPVLFTVAEEYIDIAIQGYTVIHYTASQRRTFIENFYTKQIVGLHDRLRYEDTVSLWTACILYKYGGVCVCKGAVATASLTVESAHVGPVTVATMGSLVMKEHILRIFLANARIPKAPCVVWRAVRIYVLCHTKERFDDALLRYAEYPWAVPVLMKYQDCTFENAFWKQLDELKEEWLSCKLVGTLGYTAFKKINLNMVDRIIREQIRLKNEYYHFMETEHTARLVHLTQNKIVKDVLGQIRMPPPNNAYCNYWMCTPTKMDGFLTWYDTILKPVVLTHPLIMTDSGYKSSLSVSELRALCGVPYYPQVPFVIERLNICFFKKPQTFESNIYIIGGVQGGGSLKFIHEFIQMFPRARRLIQKKDFDKITFSCNDTLVVQHLWADITPTLLCDVQRMTGCRLIINIHDFWWLDANRPHSAYLNPVIIKPAIADLFRQADTIIHPSHFTFDEYSKHFPSDRFIVSPHIDFAAMDSSLVVPPIENSTIRIGCLHEFTECKGKDYIHYLMGEFRTYKGFAIEFLAPGLNMEIYKENEFFDVVRQKGIHCLAFLNKWGETYCYSLSKFFKSGLPILYNAIGAAVERMPAKPEYMKVFESVVEFNKTDKTVLRDRFTAMLDFIIGLPKTVDGSSVDTSLAVPPLYDFIFAGRANRPIMNRIWDKIKPFCIYFPQFHRLQENDYNYYPGMTDTANLLAYIRDTGDTELDVPALCPLGEYDLGRQELVMKQVEVARDHGIYGFCVYYYWFSHNSLTGRHPIMERCYNHFFAEALDGFQIYFNWANEDWTKNPAFTADDGVHISNVYTEEWIRANFANLATYFTHPNYYKIDGCPVFSIHHPWFIGSTELAVLERIFTEECRALGFAGIHILKNSMVKQYDKSFLMAPNYKAPRKSNDYSTYAPADCREDTIQTMFFSFDNTARMYKSKKPISVRITNCTAEQQLSHLEKLLDSYRGNRSELNKLFLINSWNEWGEDMAVEPGVKHGSYYLDMLKRGFLRVLQGS